MFGCLQVDLYSRDLGSGFRVEAVGYSRDLGLGFIGFYLLGLSREYGNILYSGYIGTRLT